jgi:hypothetical protein
MPNFKKNKSAFMMKGKSPMMKALIGNQNKLPVALQKEILDSPNKKIVNRKGKVNPNSEGNTDTKEGRSKSSMAQMKYGSPMDMYGKSPAKKYKNAAQRKAVHASKAERK